MPRLWQEIAKGRDKRLKPACFKRLSEKISACSIARWERASDAAQVTQAARISDGVIPASKPCISGDTHVIPHTFVGVSSPGGVLPLAPLARRREGVHS